MAVSDTLIGTVFDGRYRIVRKLGAGGMADVYLAEDQELGRRVAIKILNDRHAADGQFIERFRREAKNAAGLSHPNIVSIAAGPRRSRRRSITRARSSPQSGSPTGTGSCTATSSRTTCS
jgi:serine/threonine protein kinase